MNDRVTPTRLAGFLLAMLCSSGCTPTAAGAEVWIEGRVELGEHGDAVILRATAADGQPRMYSVEVSASGEYRLGPVVPGAYDVSVFSTSEEYSTVHNYPAARVIAENGISVRTDFALPGSGSLDVTFPGPRPPRTLVVGVSVFDGTHPVDSMPRFSALHNGGGYWARARNTIGADDPQTHFDGLVPGPYTACAKVNVGGDNLQVSCGVVEVDGSSTAKVALHTPAAVPL